MLNHNYKVKWIWTTTTTLLTVPYQYTIAISCGGTVILNIYRPLDAALCAGGAAIDVTAVRVRVPRRERIKICFANLTVLISLGIVQTLLCLLYLPCINLIRWRCVANRIVTFRDVCIHVYIGRFGVWTCSILGPN